MCKFSSRASNKLKSLLVVDKCVTRLTRFVVFHLYVLIEFFFYLFFSIYAVHLSTCLRDLPRHQHRYTITKMCVCLASSAPNVNICAVAMYLCADCVRELNCSVEYLTEMDFSFDSFCDAVETPHQRSAHMGCLCAYMCNVHFGAVRVDIIITPQVVVGHRVAQ